MKQYFILGDSTAYGVGSTFGGWAELLKQHIHRQMYDAGGSGEQCEVFNFAKSGAVTRFVFDTFPAQFAAYSRGGETIAIVSIGGNDARAKGTPDGYVATVEEYLASVKELVGLLKQHARQIYIVGKGFVDESKTNPKVSPFDGSKSYFTNARRIEFGAALQELLGQLGVTYIDLGLTPEQWVDDGYLYIDGLHPNDKGHRHMFEAIRKSLDL